MRANSYDAATGRTIGGTSAEFSLSGAACTAEVEGPSAGTPGGLRFTYTNATGAMSVSGKPGLAFQDVSGCAGLLDLNEGDTATFHVSADITPCRPSPVRSGGPSMRSLFLAATAALALGLTPATAGSAVSTCC